MTVCHEAPACRNALNEATLLFPTRRKTSDGTCASQQHHDQNPGSDHEPTIEYKGKWYESAFDLSDDKLSGCDADRMVEDLRVKRDIRVKYVIAERRMYSSYSGHDQKTGKLFKPYEWRPYYGPNPHTTHVHVSILPMHIFNDDPWWSVPEDIFMGVGEDILAELRKQTDLIEQMNHHISGKADENARLPNIILELREIKKAVQ
jgi:hypothetical protein